MIKNSFKNNKRLSSHSILNELKYLVKDVKFLNLLN